MYFTSCRFISTKINLTNSETPMGIKLCTISVTVKHLQLILERNLCSAFNINLFAVCCDIPVNTIFNQNSPLYSHSDSCFMYEIIHTLIMYDLFKYTADEWKIQVTNPHVSDVNPLPQETLFLKKITHN